MGSRRAGFSGFRTPERKDAESFSGPTPLPPADALEAAAARARRVEELRRAVQAGTYRPDATDVAKAVVRAHTRRALFGDDH